MRVLVVGCGYVGLPLAVELAKRGHNVSSLRRSTAVDGRLRQEGVTPLHGDITQPGSLGPLPNQFDWVVNCTASGGGDESDYRRLYLEGSRHLIEWLDASCLRRFVYTSSTGVYGQNDGSTVDEASPTEPPSATARVLAETEQCLLAATRDKGFPAVILRAAGIYGPERGYLLKQFLRGDAVIEGDGARILNMIHRDDLITAIIAALERGQTGEVYNVVDDEPVSQVNFFTWLADELKQPLPPSVPPNNDTGRRRGITNKRVSNRKLKQALVEKLNYPTFREGYRRELSDLPNHVRHRSTGRNER